MMAVSPVAVVLDILTLGGLFFLGCLAVRAIVPRTDRLAYLSLGVGLGGGILTFALFLLSWAGARLDLVTILAAFGVLVIAFFGGHRYARAREPVHADPAFCQLETGSIWKWTAGLTWTLTGAIVATSMLLSVGMSYYAWDDIAIWAAKGYGIALEGTIFGGADWGNSGLLYPLNSPLLIAVFRLVDGDVWPGSKLLYPTFCVSLLLGCYRFWRRHKVHPALASLGVFLVATTPLFFTHSRIGYANLQFTFYLVMGILWTIESMEADRGSAAFLGGLLMALGVWTRPEGAVMSLAALAAIALARATARRSSLHLKSTLIPLVFIGGTWLLFSRTHPWGANEAYTLTTLAVQGLIRGQVRWEALLLVVRFMAGQILRFREWGFLLPVVGLVTLLGMRLRDLRENPAKAVLLFSTLALSLAVVGSEYMAAYSPRGLGWVYQNWLSANFNRVFMPAGLLLTLLAFLILSGMPGLAQRGYASADHRSEQDLPTRVSGAAVSGP